MKTWLTWDIASDHAVRHGQNITKIIYGTAEKLDINMINIFRNNNTTHLVQETHIHGAVYVYANHLFNTLTVSRKFFFFFFFLLQDTTYMYYMK